MTWLMLCKLSREWEFALPLLFFFLLTRDWGSVVCLNICCLKSRMILGVTTIRHKQHRQSLRHRVISHWSTVTTYSSIIVTIRRKAILNFKMITKACLSTTLNGHVFDDHHDMVSFTCCDLPAAFLIVWVMSGVEWTGDESWCLIQGFQIWANWLKRKMGYEFHFYF